jgi:hypothetical protein
LFYTLVSTGAVSFLHFCQHEESIHLSIAHDDHLAVTEAPECCHAPEKTHCASNEKSLNSEDCCETSFTELDETTANFEFDASINKNFSSTLNKTRSIEDAQHALIQQRIVFDNGPPIYLKYRKLLLYA